MSDGTAMRVSLRPQEVAARLGLGKTITRALIRSGEIKSFRVGRAVLVPVEEVDRFLAERMAASGYGR